MDELIPFEKTHATLITEYWDKKHDEWCEENNYYGYRYVINTSYNILEIKDKIMHIYNIHNIIIYKWFLNDDKLEFLVGSKEPVSSEVIKTIIVL